MNEPKFLGLESSDNLRLSGAKCIQMHCEKLNAYKNEVYLSTFMEKEMAPHSSILAWRIPMDGGAWPATVHGVTKSQTRLSD